MEFCHFEESINKIEGVISSKIVTEDGEITEIHVLADSDRSGKQILRDIETVLLISYNYRIDRKTVSIAQIESMNKSTFRRIKFNGISLCVYDNTVECCIRLEYEGEEHCITQTGIKTSANKRKIIAQTTIKAVEEIIGQASIFDVQSVIIHNSDEVSFVSVVVNMIFNDTEETMIGSTIIRSDVNEAIAKATLDAVNRRLSTNIS